MKKAVSIISCLLLICFVVIAFAACANDDQKDSLVIYNWADYIFDEDLKEFKKYYKDLTGKSIDITYVTFDTNETMLTRLTQGDSNVDVVCPSEYAIQKLIEGDMLVPMYYFDEARYTASFGDAVTGYGHNAANVEEGIIDKVSDAFGSITTKSGEVVSMVDYFVPYMYGTLGILYNKYAFMDLGIYNAEIMNAAKWGILFNDDGSGNLLSEGLTGNILMKDSIRDSYAATVFYMLESGRLDGRYNEDGKLYTDLTAGELINAVDDQLLEIVRDVLTEQKKQLFGYEVDFGKDDLLQGNAIVDLAWSGDALYAVEESWDDSLGEEGDYELAYYVPHGTGNIWFDGWVVPKTYNPSHLTAIKLFINFLNTPEAAAENFMEIGYTPAIRPDVLQNSDEARAVLSEGYVVYDPEYWDVVDEKGNPLSVDDCDFASWEEFCEYFFDSVDDIDGSNWRYPFVSTELNADNDRNIDSLGVMRDFGDKNKAVITTWNYARSAGTTALPLLLWTVLVLAVTLGALYLFILIKRLLAQRVKLSSETDGAEPTEQT